jgi:hypothetical protein
LVCWFRRYRSLVYTLGSYGPRFFFFLIAYNIVDLPVK